MFSFFSRVGGWVGGKKKKGFGDFLAAGCNVYVEKKTH